MVEDSQDSNADRNPGLLNSLRMMATTLVAILHTRLDLLATDLEEDREHLLSLLYLSIAALFSLGVAVLLATLLLVAAFWDSYRLTTLACLAALFLGVGLATAAMAVRKSKTKPRIFTSSLLELFKDREHLGQSERTP